MILYKYTQCIIKAIKAKYLVFFSENKTNKRAFGLFHNLVLSFLFCQNLHQLFSIVVNMFTFWPQTKD